MQKCGLNLFFASYLFFFFSCGPVPLSKTQKQATSKLSSITNGQNASLKTTYEIMNGQRVKHEAFQNVLGVVSDGDIICSATAVKKKLLFTSAHCFIDFEEVQVENGDSDSFDQLFSILGEEYCQSYEECLEEINLFTWKIEKRRFLDNHLEEILSQISSDVTIHQGLGAPGGKVQSDDIIQRVNIDPGWIKLVRLKLYETFNVLKRRQAAYLNNMSEYDEYAFDYAQVILRKKVNAPSLTPILKEEELEYGLPDGSKVVLVGFGHQLADDDREDVQDEDHSGPPLTPPQENDDQDFTKFYGEKMYTTLPIAGIIENDSGSFAIVAGENEGACEGDSGGAAFIKYPDGKLKYIGIITAGGDKCGDNIMWDTEHGSIQGNTIINIQLDTFEI